QKLCDSFLDRFTAVVASAAGNQVKVVTQRDVTQLLGLERQRALLGCADSGQACIVELAGALGVDALLSMSITRSDPYFVASVRVSRTRDGSPWTSATDRVQREGEVFDVMDSFAKKIVAEMTGAPAISAE